MCPIHTRYKNASPDMISATERGRRELVAIVLIAACIHVAIGTVATLRWDVIAWGSLVRAPLILAMLLAAAMATKRIGFLLLTTWFAIVTLMYMYGVFAAGYPLLSGLRSLAAIYFGWSAVRLTTSTQIRAYRQAKLLSWAAVMP
jgi:hypothetical protein